jgi:hypothetical protein
MPAEEQHSEYSLGYHFRGKRINMEPLFNELVEKLRYDLDFEFKVGKAYIGLLHTLVFAALRIQTKKIIVEFVARKEFKSPRIKKVIPAGKHRWAYFVDIKESRDIDEQLFNWIRESYE